MKAKYLLAQKDSWHTAVGLFFMILCKEKQKNLRRTKEPRNVQKKSLRKDTKDKTYKREKIKNERARKTKENGVVSEKPIKRWAFLMWYFLCFFCGR